MTDVRDNATMGRPSGAKRRIHPAWVVAAVTFVTLVGAAAFRSVPGVLMTPLHHEFGWSHGTIGAAVTFIRESDALVGSAVGAGETVALRDISSEPTADGEHVTWAQTITRPLRLNLEFDVTVSGDRMTGHSRAGKLPRSTVTGTRAP